MRQNRALESGFWTLLLSLGSASIGLLFVGFSVRFLGMERAGLANAVNALLAMNATIGGLGLGTAAIRELSILRGNGRMHEAGAMIGTFYAVTIVVGLVGLGICVGGRDLLLAWAGYQGNVLEARFFIFCAGLSFLFTQVNGVYFAVLQGTQRFDLYAPISLSASLLNSLAGSIVLAYKPDLYAFGICLIGVNMVTCGVLVGSTRISEAGWILPSFSFHVFVRLLKFGKWVYISSIAGLAGSGLDRLLVVSSVGLSALPAYNYARRFLEIVHGLLVGQSSFLLPVFSAKQDVSKGKILFSAWVYFAIGVLLYGAVITLASGFAGLVVNDAFAAQVRIPAMVFSIIGLAQTLTIAPFQICLGLGLSRLNTFCQILFLVLMLPCMFLGAKLGGLNGAVIGQFSIILIVIIYMRWFIRDTMRGEVSGYGMLRVCVRPLLVFGLFLILAILEMFWSIRFILMVLMSSILMVVAACYLLRQELANPSHPDFPEIIQKILAYLEVKVPASGIIWRLVLP